MAEKKKVLVLLAEGFEEIEAVTVIDVLRRAEIEVQSASLNGTKVTGSHGIALVADATLDDVEEQMFDAVVLPGGMPGARHLRESHAVLNLLRDAAHKGKFVAAICAAPTALDVAGVLKGRRATSYPGHELTSADYVEEPVVVDGNIITSRGPGTAFDFSLKLVEKLVGPEVAELHRDRLLLSS
jgi:4-methyl-5(b-hydroxyethyl)-thiazole monophosphate biosynthesis